MDLSFNSEQEILRKSVAEFLAKECPFDVVKDIEDSESGYLPKVWKKIAKLGWLEMMLPEEYGGFGDSFANMLIILEEMGKHAFVSPFMSTVIKCGYTIIEGGSDAQKKGLLKKIANGKLIMALAQYEEEASYLESGIQMSAELTGDQYVLNGTKMFVLDANISEKLIVTARTKEGVTLFIVNAKDAGIACTKMRGIGKDNICELIFNNVKVSKDNVLGEVGKGWEILEKALVKITLAKCAEMVGGCKSCIDMTAEYAKNRVQYGKPIGGFQVIQHYLADMLVAYDTSFNYMYKVAWMVDENMNCSHEVSAMKAQVNEKFKYISERSVQIFGGVGTTREFDIGLFYRRAKAYEFDLGDSEYHYELIAQKLGL